MAKENGVAEFLNFILKHKNTDNLILAAKCIGNLEDTTQPKIIHFIERLKIRLTGGIDVFRRIHFVMFLLLSVVWLLGFLILAWTFGSTLKVLYHQYFDFRILLFAVYFFGIPGLFILFQQMLVNIFRKRATIRDIIPAIMALRYVNTPEAERAILEASRMKLTFKPDTNDIENKKSGAIDDILKTITTNIIAEHRKIEKCEDLLQEIQKHGPSVVSIAVLLSTRIDLSCVEKVISLANQSDPKIQKLARYALRAINRYNKSYQNIIFEKLKDKKMRDRIDFYLVPLIKKISTKIFLRSRDSRKI